MDWLPALGAFIGAVVGAGVTVWGALHRTSKEDAARRWELKQNVYFEVLAALDEHRNVIHSWGLREDGNLSDDDHRLVPSSRTLSGLRSKCIVVGGVPVATLLDDVLDLHRDHLPTEVSGDRLRFAYEAILKRMNEEIGQTKNPATKAPEPMGPQFCGQ